MNCMRLSVSSHKSFISLAYNPCLAAPVCDADMSYGSFVQCENARGEVFGGRSRFCDRDWQAKSHSKLFKDTVAIIQNLTWTIPATRHLKLNHILMLTPMRRYLTPAQQALFGTLPNDFLQDVDITPPSSPLTQDSDESSPLKLPSYDHRGTNYLHLLPTLRSTA
ncbi:hypothetical protein K503DRAFT_487372 [Rhizopogon vinicolor AM-OR11-026]|uniref:Uncharacterized protein n=1 Tax=Rhizopogon vinicolor AM-OR11-026 TaxID=1314800 RepID=A0A1B7MMQ5_9AGAM|nr:hypothetical protein K503DRAFT_487372 [Rhizopogon vinicolor AM-OR11-026]